MMIKPIYKYLLKIVIAIILLFFILRSVGFSKAYKEAIHAEIVYIFISIIIGIASIIFIAIRWKNTARIFYADIDFLSALKYTFISFAFGIITPGRFGEFVKVKYMSDRANINYFKSLIIMVMDKIFDVAVLIFFAVISLSFFKSPKTEFFIIFLVLFIVIFILMLLFFRPIQNYIISVLPNKWKWHLKNLNFQRKIFLKSLFFSLIIWGISGVQAFYIFLSLKIYIPFLYILGIVSLLALSSILPISIGGLGVREIVAIYFLLFLGINAEKSAVFSLIYTFSGLGVPAVIGIILYILGGFRSLREL